MKILRRASALLGVLVLGAGCGASSTNDGAFHTKGSGDPAIPAESPPEAGPSADTATGTMGASFGATGTGTGTSSPPVAGPTTGVASPPMTGAAGSAGTTTTNQGVAASLTAGTWDDNLNFDFYEKYLASDERLAGRRPAAHRPRGAFEITVLDAAGARRSRARTSP